MGAGRVPPGLPGVFADSAVSLGGELGSGASRLEWLDLFQFGANGSPLLL
jgi:hypothetical protein